jgi:hypothetical protein
MDGQYWSVLATFPNSNIKRSSRWGSRANNKENFNTLYTSYCAIESNFDFDTTTRTKSVRHDRKLPVNDIRRRPCHFSAPLDLFATRDERIAESHVCRRRCRSCRRGRRLWMTEDLCAAVSWQWPLCPYDRVRLGGVASTYTFGFSLRSPWNWLYSEPYWDHGWSFLGVRWGVADMQSAVLSPRSYYSTSNSACRKCTRPK